MHLTQNRFGRSPARSPGGGGAGGKASLLSSGGNNANRLLGDGHFGVGDPIVVSSEAGHFALAIGFVKEVHEKSIVLSLDRDVFEDPSRVATAAEDDQSFEGMWSLNPEDNANPTAAAAAAPPRLPVNTVFRIDRDELTAGLGLIRNNIVNLFTAEGDAKRRRLIVESEPPQFSARSDFAADVQQRLPNWNELNVDQQAAVEKVFTGNTQIKNEARWETNKNVLAEDYVLILGMPGTGKTTTIAKLIRYLVLQVEINK